MSARISGAATWVRRQDWVLGAQLGCALVVTFHAEYTLALAAGVNEYVALAVPGALDLYVIRALQKHRDVLLAVLVMVAANVASHLVSAGIIPVNWAVYSAVGGTVPLLLWRGHALRYMTGTRTGAVSAPVPEASTPVPEAVLEPVPVQVSEVQPVPAPLWTPGFHLDGCDGMCQGTGPVACVQRMGVLDAVASEYAVPEDRTRRSTDVPDHVPAEWVQPGTPETYPPLTAVPNPPDVPAEYAPGAVHSPVLEDSDWAYLARAEEYVHGCKDVGRKPSIRGMRAACKGPDGKGIGQERAERLLEHLGVEP